MLNHCIFIGFIKNIHYVNIARDSFYNSFFHVFDDFIPCAKLNTSHSFPAWFSSDSHKSTKPHYKRYRALMSKMSKITLEMIPKDSTDTLVIKKKLREIQEGVIEIFNLKKIVILRYQLLRISPSVPLVFVLSLMFFIIRISLSLQKTYIIDGVDLFYGTSYL